VGSATLLDPQTGHYTTELPIAPEMLGEPKVLTGTENALRGFNSSVGTVSYSWSKITKGGSLTIGGGDHNLNFQRIHHALTGSYGDSKDWTWGAEIEGSRSESDGTIPSCFWRSMLFDRTRNSMECHGVHRIRSL
jgi:vitamin B12 transporter